VPPQGPVPPPQLAPLRPRPLTRVLSLLIPRENPAAAVYGLIATGALLAVDSGIRETYLDTILATAVAAALYWLLHAYARVLGDRLRDRRPMSATILLGALARDRTIMRGAAVPIGALLVSWLAGAGQSTGVTIALWSTVGALVAFELVAALRVQASLRELLLDGAVGVTMGVGILALKIILH
jgi:hypothetical protein